MNENKAIIGMGDKTEWFLRHAKQPFLLIDDGPVADAFAARFRRAKQFDIAKHHFNPLQGIDHKRAREVAAALYGYDQAGEETLTVRNGRRAIARYARKFDSLEKIRAWLEHRADEGELTPTQAEALATLEDVLFSPMVAQVLSKSAPKPFDGFSVIVRLDRSVIDEFDAYILGALIMGEHQGQIIVPDFDFYGRPLHMSLIRQKRLLCGITALKDLPDQLQRQVLLFPVKEATRCLPEDAERLAAFSGYLPGQQGRSEFVQDAVG